jgi:hypothetical protein
MVSEPTHRIPYLRAANHRRGFKSVVCETHLGNVSSIIILKMFDLINDAGGGTAHVLSLKKFWSF